MNHIDLQNILFLDIETVSGEPNFEALSGDMQELWANKTKWQRKEDITAKEYYADRAGILAEFGKIVCISVNDPNVMKAWGEIQNIKDKIFMAADPFCEFTKLIGAEVDKSEKGLGTRSSRYTMLVENEVIRKIKEEKDTGICEISAAESFIKDI